MTDEKEEKIDSKENEAKNEEEIDSKENNGKKSKKGKKGKG